MEEIKRLFFGIEIHSPWPTSFPHGRLLDEAHRHMTLAFLGNIPYDPLRIHLDSFPIPQIKLGSTGYFEHCLTLPPSHPHVIAWEARWFEEESSIASFQRTLSNWLRSQKYTLDERPWKPHVTLCRQPFDALEWKKSFVRLPFYTSSIHLYESQGQLQYIPIWSYSILPPFEEVDHTADIAFHIRGETLQQLYYNAFTALAFKAPEILGFFENEPHLNSLDDLIIALNSIIAHADRDVGCMLKAVSFHGEIIVLRQSISQWEMIVDV